MSSALDTEALLDAAPSAIQPEIVAAAMRALSAGASTDLQYLGAGAEGILFVDGAMVYKVGRQGDLEDEADALEALNRDPQARAFVPQFVAYYPEIRVLVRSLVDGAPGRWSQGAMLRPIYDLLARALNTLDFSSPEWKENSFVVPEKGSPVMVDLGFASPIRAREVHWLRRTLFSKEFRSSESAFIIQLRISEATRGGFLTYIEGLRMSDRLAEVFEPSEVSDSRAEYMRNYTPLGARR